MKKFLTTFASIAAGFASSQAAASVESPKPPESNTDQSQRIVVPPASPIISVKDSRGDKFDFVLSRSSETGFLMAEHQSHSSHASHASHASHYSSSN